MAYKQSHYILSFIPFSVLNTFTKRDFEFIFRMFHCVGPNKTPSRKRKPEINMADQEDQGPCGPGVQTVSPSTVLANPMKSMRLSPIVKCTGKSRTASENDNQQHSENSTPATQRPPTSGKGTIHFTI